MDCAPPPLRKVLYSVIVGGYDTVRRPPAITGWDFVLFTDRPDRLRHRLGRMAGRLGGRYWDVRPLPGDGGAQALLSRLPKILPHLYLADYDYSLYIDASIEFLRDPTPLAAARGWPTFLAAEHPYREDVYAEAEECLRARKADPEVLQRQIGSYAAAGLPKSVPLTANGIMFRRHMDPALIALNEDWWREMNAHSHRDQISLPYVRWRHDFLIETIDRETYRAHFRVRSHGRSLTKRLRRSFKKRLDKLRGA